jgi:uncharacterized membrane protein
MLEWQKRRLDNSLRKDEFLNILKETLSGEISPESMRRNINYYDQYIGSNPKEEEKIVEELGDPRLIAKTIIDTDRIAKEKGKHTGGNDDQRYSYDRQDNGEENHQKRNSQRTTLFNNIQWHHKAIFFFAILLFLIIILILGRFIIGILFTFGIPILLIFLLLSIFRRR